MYVLVFLQPTRQLLNTPLKRAEAYVVQTICQRPVATTSAAHNTSTSSTAAVWLTHNATQLTDLAQPFVPTFKSRWYQELATVLLALLALITTMATLRKRSYYAAPIALASAIAFVVMYGFDTSAFTLLRLAGLRLWLQALSQWDFMLLAERVLGPVALCLIFTHAIWLLVNTFYKTTKASSNAGPVLSA